MHKRSINLLPSKKPVSPVVLRIQKHAPLIAGISLALFIISFFFSFLYVKTIQNSYNRLSDQVHAAEQSISSKKSAEGVYVVSVNVLETISEIFSGRKSYKNVLSALNALSLSGISFQSISIDEKRNVSISVLSPSYTALHEFVSTLIAKNTEGQFTNIQTQGVVRDRDGVYRLIVSLSPDAALFQ